MFPPTPSHEENEAVMVRNLESEWKQREAARRIERDEVLASIYGSEAEQKRLEHVRQAKKPR